MHFLVQVSVFTITFFCLRDARKRRQTALFLFLLFDASVFEFLILQLYEAVQYSSEFFSLGGVPLLVPAGWAILLYPLLDVVKSRSIFLKSIFISLAAASLDLVLDKAAVVSGFWSWNKEIGYFGVPYDNFFAWYIYAFLVTLAVQLFLNKINFKSILNALLFISVVGLTLGFLWTILPIVLRSFLWWLIFIGALAVSIKQLSKLEFRSEGAYSLFIPLAFYLFAFLLILINWEAVPIYYILISFLLFAFWVFIAVKKLSVVSFFGKT